jgi:hypothetical protein
MPHENRWFLITSEEMDKIRIQLSILSGEIPENSRDGVDSIGRIINTIELRQK